MCKIVTLRTILLALAAIPLTACEFYVSNNPDPGNSRIIEVASYQQPCPNPAAGMCRLERAAGTLGWELRNDTITGFYPEWGKSYRLEVQDGWSSRELVSILDAWEDAVGTRYNVNYLTLIDGSFSGWSNSNYRFFDQPFVCNGQINCQALVNMSGSYGVVSLQFRYTGNSFVPLELIWWN